MSHKMHADSCWLIADDDDNNRKTRNVMLR